MTSDKSKEGKPVEISVAAALESKLGARSRWIPRFVVRWLEGLVHQEEMNTLLRHLYPRRGADFCRGCLEELGITVRVKDSERLPATGRAVFVSNHPLGGLDGIALIAELSRTYPDAGTVKFVVNDILMAVEPLTDNFIPVNKHGHQSRGDLKALDAALASDAPVIIFPAGLVSRRIPDGSGIADLRWHKMFVAKALEYGRPVVPLFFSGRNSSFFYRFASWRKRSGLKLNIEMVRLPAEVFRARGAEFSIVCGEPISPEELRAGSPQEQAQKIREICYSLEQRNI